MTQTPAFIAAERRHLTPPEPPPILRGMIARYLAEGTHEEREVEIEYELDDDKLTILEATGIETGEEIDPQEIGDYDRAKFAEQIRETHYDNYDA